MRKFQHLASAVLIASLSGCAATPKPPAPTAASTVEPTDRADTPAAAPSARNLPGTAAARDAAKALGGQPTVAVFDFENGGDAKPAAAGLGSTLANSMVAELGSEQRLTIVDRRHLTEVLHEQEISSSDLANPTTRLRVGHLVGAKFIVFGTYMILGDHVAGLTAEMDAVETDTAVKLKVKSKTGTPAELMNLRLSRELGAELVKSLDTELASQPGNATGASGSGGADQMSQLIASGDDSYRGHDYAKAAEAYTKALALDPHSAEVRAKLDQASIAAARQ